MDKDTRIKVVLREGGGASCWGWGGGYKKRGEANSSAGKLMR